MGSVKFYTWEPATPVYEWSPGVFSMDIDEGAAWQDCTPSYDEPTSEEGHAEGN
jgi:hypothetical protein